jgi:hypothetical protein
VELKGKKTKGGTMPEQARLKVYGQGDVEVELATTYLGDLKHAYDSVLVFEATIDRMYRATRYFSFPWDPSGLDFGWPLASRRGMRRTREWPPTSEEVASLVPVTEQLILTAVTLTSPGFWEFLGTLNPLEVLRQYLNDRHERRKDREYRESAERRRLMLDNLSLENKVISERVRLAREIGATARDLAPLLNELVYKPLVALDRYQDKGVVENSEILPPDPDRR